MNYKAKYYKQMGLDQCDPLYCVICQKIAVNLHHIQYKSQGGSDEYTNLAPLCFDHHDGHHTRNNPTTEEIREANLLNNPIF